MWVEIKIFLVLHCALLTEGSNQNITTTPMYTNHVSCNDTVLSELDECWNKLPEVIYDGIPSDPEKIENACRVFLSGMECVDTWSQTCLSVEAQEVLESSITGALQVYKLLCSNSTFREEFLQHANCYVRTSTYLDACNNQFIMTLDRIDHANDVQSLCW
ncbi:unnamed protein product [Orchesella dallaii]|uniref:DUF19 domain-containing protein n=1 Tax=Orchesella dallaii TaxID=48710 RepID=A0ABP1RZN0_9HEXA